jgi:hypothetical protein
VQIC